MTDKWQDRYQITSTTGRIWTRRMVKHEAAKIAKSMCLDIDLGVLNGLMSNDKFMLKFRGGATSWVCRELAIQASLPQR